MVHINSQESGWLTSALGSILVLSHPYALPLTVWKFLLTISTKTKGRSVEQFFLVENVILFTLNMNQLLVCYYVVLKSYKSIIDVFAYRKPDLNRYQINCYIFLKIKCFISFIFINTLIHP